MKTVVISSGRVLKILALTSRGRCEFYEFMADLNKSEKPTAAKLQKLIDYSAEFGKPKNPDQCKKLVDSDEIWEFKAKKARLLWFHDDGDTTVVISHGFMKKTKKTPPREIDRAEDRRMKYFSGSEETEDE